MQQPTAASPRAAVAGVQQPEDRAFPVDRALFWTVVLVSAAIFVFNLVWHMADQNLADWDESRHAVSAYEMWRSGDLLVNTYRGAVDYWNLKPPLSFWPIILSFQVFGPSILALRLPSVLEMLATGVIVVVFVHRRFGPRGTLIVAPVFATCLLFFGSHSGRTADPDALYLFFFTVGVLAVLLAPERPGFLLLWTTAFSAAFLTKSWHAGLLLVGGVLFLSLRGRASAARLRDYAVALLGFLPLLAWAAVRLSFDGLAFFQNMVAYDLLSRSSTAIEGHGGGPAFYVVRLAYFVPWVLLLAVPLLARRHAVGGPSSARSWRTADWLGPLVFTTVIFGAFSLAASKLDWYVFPALPSVLLLIGLLASRVTAGLSSRGARRLVLAGILVAAGYQGYVLSRIPAPESGPQVALSRLEGVRGIAAEPLYLDPSLRLAIREPQVANIGEWPQSLRASALLHAQARPAEGGGAAFLSDAGHARLILVRDGSATDRQVSTAPTSAVAVSAGFRVLELSD